jgi:hypothetical protein
VLKRRVARTRYLYRITEGDTVISEEQITGCSYHPAGNVLRQELIAAGSPRPKEPTDSSPGTSPENRIQSRACRESHPWL